MNAAKSETLSSIQQPWAHFDKSPGDIVIAERDYIEGEYTFGASNKCRITLEFTELVIPSLTGRAGNTSMGENGCVWLQVRFPIGDPEAATAAFQIGSGFFNFDAGSGQPTTGWSWSDGAHEVFAPVSEASWSTFGDIANEVFTLQIAFDRTANHPNITVDFRTPRIVLVNSANYTGAQPDDVRTPGSFIFRTGSRLLANGPYESPGAYGHRITKFYCEDIA